MPKLGEFPSCRRASNFSILANALLAKYTCKSSHPPNRTDRHSCHPTNAESLLYLPNFHMAPSRFDRKEPASGFSNLTVSHTASLRVRRHARSIEEWSLLQPLKLQIVAPRRPMSQQMGVYAGSGWSQKDGLLNQVHSTLLWTEA